ncbi:MAG: hypothetical protein JNM41_11750 [Flavipsychrobacter sp.]|jgi:hypothetical protein|nr:hypothetical protein [Flavipsychrobacter sp.]
MSTANKILAGTVIGAGAIAAIAYLKNIKRAQAQLEIIPVINIHQISLEGLTVRVDALLKNPTGASFKIKYPFVKLNHKDALLGSSQAVNKDIKIPAFGQVMIKDIMIKVPVLSFFSVGYDIIKALMNKQPITLTISVITTADLGVTQVAIEHKQDMTLKK